MKDLNLSELRAANQQRVGHFKNAKGGPAHDKTDGSDWSPLEWGGALAGEVGELLNIIKKVRRGDLTMEEARPSIAAELADAQCYLDLVAMQCGVNLGEATIEKFNAVSKRVGSFVKLKGVSADETDWTEDNQGRANHSVAFDQIVGAVVECFRGNATAIINGGLYSVARLAVAKIAHEYRMAPRGAK